eukprot:1526935-Rhodomonas_salina.3
MLSILAQRPPVAVARDRILGAVLAFLFLALYPDAAVSKLVKVNGWASTRQVKPPRPLRFVDALEEPRLNARDSATNRLAAAQKIRELTGKQEPGRRRGRALWTDYEAAAERKLHAVDPQKREPDPRRGTDVGQSIIESSFSISAIESQVSKADSSLRRNNVSTPVPEDQEGSGSSPLIGFVIG